MEDNNSAEMRLRLLVKAVVQEHGENLDQDRLIQSLRGKIGFESTIIPAIGLIRIRSIVFEELSANIMEGEGR